MTGSRHVLLPTQSLHPQAAPVLQPSVSPARVMLTPPPICRILGEQAWVLQQTEFNKPKAVVTAKFTSNPLERFFEVVVAFCGNVEVLKVLLAVEVNLLRLDFAVFDFDLVSRQNDWDVLANAGEIAMPVRHIFVRNSRCHVEHNDGAVPHKVITITKPSELLLTRRVPHIELNRPSGRMEAQRVHFHAQSCDIFLLKLSREMTFHEGCLAHTSISYEDELELWNHLGSHPKFG
jgi:hypothetical protein